MEAGGASREHLINIFFPSQRSASINGLFECGYTTIISLKTGTFLVHLQMYLLITDVTIFFSTLVNIFLSVYFRNLWAVIQLRHR